MGHSLFFPRYLDGLHNFEVDLLESFFIVGFPD